MNNQKKFTTRSIKLKKHRANSQTISSFPVKFSTYYLFFSFFCLFLSSCFALFCIVFVFFFVFLKLKIYILIHIRLCRRVSDKKNSPGRFPETRLLFLPDGKDELNASPIWDRSQNLFFVLSPGYITFLCLKPRLYHKLVNTINRSVRFSESPVCFILPLFYKC